MMSCWADASTGLPMLYLPDGGRSSRSLDGQFCCGVLEVIPGARLELALAALLMGL